MTTPTRDRSDRLVARLRRAGCVFAEDEAAILRRAAAGDDLERLIVRREAGEFLEHLVGAVEIAGEVLDVGPGVFVPRQRTVLLVEAAIAEARTRVRPVVVEAYCGVAPVAALVGRRVSGVQLHVTDCDERALAYARTNLPSAAAVHHGVGLGALPQELAGSVDLLVAVPPYVPSAAVDLLPREAREHEEAAALVSGADGLDEVRVLVRGAPSWLAPGGVLLLEMHRRQAPSALAVAQATSAWAERGFVVGEDGETAIVRLVRAGCDGARAAGAAPSPDAEEP